MLWHLYTQRSCASAILLPFFLSACFRSAADVELERLARRVDSLAVTVTAMNASLNGGAGAAQPESTTVSGIGAAALGNSAASVTIVEFTDYQCPYCARHAMTTLKQIRDELIDRGIVRYVIRDLPLTEIHPLAGRAARAARCAGAQADAKYWRYHDEIFAAQKTLADSSFQVIARRVGLDLGAFSDCVDSNRFASEMVRDARAAAASRLDGTPAFVVGRSSTDGAVTGVVIRGAYPYSRFKAAVDGALGPAAIAARE